ncbi:hypothetical protein N7468_008507 [Penicillium chermesinum]|uniref:Uncharacterized protein n=1 Tax=Penicillium chermesinum TaxID=63820 RepID=A0A9W9NPZ0_9EURO|nr:uncharacterized protein N7468_008507 [Penicillium chermesinum]KAJ5223965.1 hypothetical protein N7468_008507 [Penicillium chermesinum]
MPVDGDKSRRIWAPWIAFTAPLRGGVFKRPSRGWRPLALRPPYLAALFFLMLTMFMVVEALRQYSVIKGGLYFFDDTDDVSALLSFLYGYLPIIISLLLFIVWIITDFDVLRLEPYYQLSRPEGAPATVLFINYNFGQTILTPINAARRRHWIVLWVSMMTLVMRMILPALQSTLFELREVDVIDHVHMRSWPNLVDLDTQAKWMSTQANNTVDDVLSSDDYVHRTRSKDYALAPVEIPDDGSADTLWNIDQTLYWAQLSCENVYVNRDLTVTIQNGAGSEKRISWSAFGTDPNDDVNASSACQLDFNYTSIFFPETDFLQVRYWEPAISQLLKAEYPNQTHAFTATGCDPYDLYGMMIAVNATNQDPNNSQYTASGTAFACDIEYQKANADVQMHSNSSITNIKIRQSTTQTLTSHEFNIAQFHALLSQHSPYTSDMLFIRENTTTDSRIVTELPVISQELGELEPLLILDTATVMTQAQFESRIRRDVKQTFVLTLGRLFDPDRGATIIPATSTTAQVALAIVNFAAISTELILALACLTALYLIFLYQSRESFLQSDPGSIGAMCSIAADVFHPFNLLANPHAEFHQFSTRQLNRMLRHARCYWRMGPYGNRLEILAEDGSPVLLEENQGTRVDPMPHFLLVPFFIIEFLALAAIIILMALVVSSLERDGRFRHLTQSDSSALQVVLSVLPSIVASSVGSLCTSIYRNLAVLEPWVHLQRGMAAAASSLSLNYASQSPLMVFIKCVRNKNVLLGLVSMACVVNMALTVVVGGLFSQELQTSSLPTDDLTFNYSRSTFWRNDFAAEFTEYDLIQTSITSGVPMLSWTSSNQSFIPVMVRDGDPSVLYGANTLGISASLECAPLTPEDGLKYNKTSGESYWQYSLFADDSVECIAPMPPLGKDEGIALAVHFLSPFDKRTTGRNQTDACQTATVLVVGQWDYMADTSVTDNNSVALHCEPKIQMQDFAITFDSRGQINSHYSVPNTSITDGIMYENATVSLGQFNKVFAAIPDSYVGNTTAINGTYNVSSYDWAGFLVARLYERADPDFDALDIDIMTDLTRVVYQWVYSTYFSIWRHIYLEPLEHPIHATNSTIIQSTWCMVPSVPSLAIALIIIAFDTLVVLLVFGTRRGRFRGPRMPRSIGAVIPWIAHSQMLRDFSNTHHWTNTERRAHLSSLNKRYTFRMFLGPDSRWRFAVDEEPPGPPPGPPPPPPPPPDEPPDQPPPQPNGSKSTSIQLKELIGFHRSRE